MSSLGSYRRFGIKTQSPQTHVLMKQTCGTVKKSWRPKNCRRPWEVGESFPQALHCLMKIVDLVPLFDTALGHCFQKWNWFCSGVGRRVISWFIFCLFLVAGTHSWLGFHVWEDSLTAAWSGTLCPCCCWDWGDCQESQWVCWDGRIRLGVPCFSAL